ncbi:MAG: amino acid adenylation domain-containing protein [Ktedonobacteraceae bacterium]
MPNGKVNYALLPVPDMQQATAGMRFVAPRDPIEETLAGIWSSVLGIEQIGVYYDFFLLGGHSLLAARTIARIRDVFNIELSFQELIESSTIAQLAKLIKQGRQSVQPLLPPPLQPGSRDRPIPLAFAQQRQWLQHQLDSTNTLYTLFGGLRLRGLVQPTVVEQALQEIIHRHETLRTTFNVVDGQPVQRIASSALSALTVVEAQAWPAIEQEAEVQRLVDAEKRRVIDLAHGPLLHVTLVRLTNDNSLLLFTSHHIIFDGWSVEIFLREFATLYVAFAQGEPSPLPALRIQYADYSLWQQNWLQGPVLETLLAYWKEQLAHLPVLTLPTERPRPTRPTFRAATIPLQLCPALTTEVKEFCRREGVTIFMALLAVFQCILSRYSGQYDIVVGSPVANRGWTEVEELIGSFMNTQVLRTNLSGNPTFRELLGRVRSVAFQAHTYQALPFEILLEQVHVERNAGRNPLFQALFAYQNTPGEQVHLPGIEVSFLENASETTMFDIDLSLWESEGKVQGGLKYSTDLFDAPIIEHMHNDFIALLGAVVHDPTQHIANISYLSSEEQRNVLVEWNRTQADYADERCIHELFESQVARTPNAVAAVFHGESLTYQQVEHQANQVAHHLRALGIGPGAMVAVLMDRSLEMIPALLGILKSGAAYVPFEPAFPRTRLQLLLSTLSIPVVITQLPYLTVIENLQDIPELKHVICLDHESTIDTFSTQKDWQVWTCAQLDVLPVESVAVQVSSNDIAYVIFTSGSTGMPKGVMVRHQPVINLIEWVNKTFQMQETDRVLFVTSLCFDLSVYDIFGLLAVGGSLEIVANTDIRDPERLLDLIYQQPITFWDSAPAALQQLVPLFQTRQPIHRANRLRLVFLSGDWIPITLPDTVRAAFPGSEVVSLGGATEATVWSNYFRIREVAPQWASIPYGQPIQNAQYYVLDAYLQPCQVGVAGDLYIGGQCLAEGYINAPVLTAQKFLPDPFSQTLGARLYKTGDQARFWSDGTIEFLGRADTQVKIRGFRIELGEIEATLLRHPTVHAAAVEARQDETGEKSLVAYVVMEQEQDFSIRTLRQHLQEHLPAYMVPAAFMQLEALPLTTQGKVDRQRLPLPDAESKRGLAVSYVAPRTTVEETLAQIWAAVLHLPRVGVEDNFFEIGGHSLLSLQLIARIRTTWQIEMPLRDLFETQTVAEMALRIEQAIISTSSNVNTTMSPLDVQAEANLDAAIYGKKADESTETEPAHIFLTGASGFLGSVLLAELLQTCAATIYCLVRSTDGDDGKRKLRRALERIDSWRPEFATRIVPVPGDLAQPCLGLSDEHFEQLAQTIDVIYHSGALVNTVYDYQELKAVNVLGTQEMLRLATTGNVKPFHYISTLSVLSPEARVAGTALFEEEPLDLHGTYMRDGYAQSKWVAEKLVTIARARGVPCTIYRPGRITGHSLYGTWPTDDILCRRLKGCIQLGRIPTIVMSDLLEMTPVDYVGRAIVALSRQQQSSGKTFHLCNNSGVSVNELIKWINEFGYRIRQVSYAQWISALKGNATETGDNVLLPFLSLLPDEVEEATPQEQAAGVLIDDQQTRTGLASTGITCPAIDATLLTTYLSYFVRSGFLPAPIPTDDNR